MDSFTIFALILNGVVAVWNGFRLLGDLNPDKRVFNILAALAIAFLIGCIGLMPLVVYSISVACACMIISTKKFKKSSRTLEQARQDLYNAMAAQIEMLSQNNRELREVVKDQMPKNKPKPPSPSKKKVSRFKMMDMD